MSGIHFQVGTAIFLVFYSERTIDTDPNAQWIFIADNLNTHKSEGLVNLVIERLGLELSSDNIGLKGKVLSASQTRPTDQEYNE